MAVRSSISNKNEKPVGKKVPTGSVYDKIQISIKYFICLKGKWQDFWDGRGINIEYKMLPL